MTKSLTLLLQEIKGYYTQSEPTTTKQLFSLKNLQSLGDFWDLSAKAPLGSCSDVLGEASLLKVGRLGGSVLWPSRVVREFSEDRPGN